MFVRHAYRALTNFVIAIFLSAPVLYRYFSASSSCCLGFHVWPAEMISFLICIYLFPLKQCVSLQVPFFGLSELYSVSWSATTATYTNVTWWGRKFLALYALKYLQLSYRTMHHPGLECFVLFEKSIDCFCDKPISLRKYLKQLWKMFCTKCSERPSQTFKVVSLRPQLQLAMYLCSDCRCFSGFILRSRALRLLKMTCSPRDRYLILARFVVNKRYNRLEPSESNCSIG